MRFRLPKYSKILGSGWACYSVLFRCRKLLSKRRITTQLGRDYTETPVGSSFGRGYKAAKGYERSGAWLATALHRPLGKHASFAVWRRRLCRCLMQCRQLNQFVMSKLPGGEFRHQSLG